jgi:PAS domain S-box-containing protein
VATALLTGPTHVFELANPLYRKIVGGREVLGKAYLEAFPELADSALPAVLDRVYQTGEPFVAEEYQVPFDRKGTGDLEDCYFRFSLQPLRDDDGNVRGMMAMALDVTEQVNARRVLERATLERERLLNQLKAANHAKDEFLATVSHELRTPLTSILGWSRLLSEASDPLRIQKGLAVIERNAKSQAQLIEDILDVSRIISGKLRMNMRRVDPVAVVHAAVETVRPHATAKQVRMLVDVEAGVPPLVADEDRLQQVVWNLLSNAVKFSSADGEISVRLRQVESRIVISVADKGKGISPEFLPHVFDRFRQDDTSTTKQHAGLGLGLSIVHHLVELHGGTVVARSDGEGKGACFEVSMPIRAVQLREPSEPPQPSTNEERTSGYEMPQLRGVHALVLDDQDDARELVATVLHDAGAKVTQANSVAAAMKVLAEQPVSVLVSDIGMPHEDGYSFIQRVRSDLASFESGRVPALALTAYARAEDRKKALDAGFQEHVAKPIDPLELVHVVARLIHA